MKKDNNESFDLKCLEKGIKYKRVGEYINSRTKIDFQCYKCNSIWLTKPSNILQGFGCFWCNKGGKKDTNESFDLKNTTKYKRVGGYINALTKTNFLCPECANTWEVTPNTILQGYGCPVCGGTKKDTNESFDLKCVEKGIKYIRVGEYTNNKTKIEFHCPNCTNNWRSTPNNILNGNGCPTCSNSGFNHTSEASLYFIEIITPWDTFLKVGITNRENIMDRISQIKNESKAIRVEVIQSIKNTGIYIYELEQKIHKQYQHYIPSTVFSGYTECFALNLKEEILNVFGNI